MDPTPQPPPYLPNVPQPKSTIDDAQPDFLNNFLQLYNAFSSDHIPLDATTNAGNHNVIRLAEQAMSLATSTSELGWYIKKVETQTDQIFFRAQGNGLELQYTNYQIYPLAPIVNIGGVVVQIPFFSFLPGGVIVYFGQIFPTTSIFDIILNPPICASISAINLGLNNIPPTYQPKSTVAPKSDIPGIITSIQLTPALFTPSVVPSQSYIIFGIIP